MICYDLSKNCEIALSSLPSTVLALGNFDGVHLGHRALLKETVVCAKALSEKGSTVAPGVWLFRTPPSDILKTPPPPHLSSVEDKCSIFRSEGIRYAILGEFSELASLSPCDFALHVLKEACHCRHAVCGFNYSFGFKGLGTPALLSECFDGAVSVIDPVMFGDSPVSSTRIRNLLTNGNVREAAVLLGRPYALVSEVLHGKALGRTLDFPTANQMFLQNTVIPKNGIYAAQVILPGGAQRYGVANIGLRPTVEHTASVNCETYIFDFSGNLYGEVIEVRFMERLRDERKMSGIEELRLAIQNDANAARSFFGLPTQNETKEE